MKNIASITINTVLSLVLCAFFLLCQTALGQTEENKPIKNQEPVLIQDNKTKLIYVPERTKEELAEQRLQKREKEAIELQKINDGAEYRAIDETQPVKSELIKMEIYKVSETQIKLEEPLLMKEYKPEVKKEEPDKYPGKQEQQLKKEKLQKPENKK